MLSFSEIGVENKVLTLFSDGGQGYKSKDQRHDERGAEVEVVDWYNRLEIKDKQS